MQRFRVATGLIKKPSQNDIKRPQNSGDVQMEAMEASKEQKEAAVRGKRRRVAGSLLQFAPSTSQGQKRSAADPPADVKEKPEFTVVETIETLVRNSNRSCTPNGFQGPVFLETVLSCFVML